MKRSGGEDSTHRARTWAQALPWLVRLPGVPAKLREMQAAGRAEESWRGKGGWRRTARGEAARRCCSSSRAPARPHLGTCGMPPSRSTAAQQCQRGSARPSEQGAAAPDPGTWRGRVGGAHKDRGVQAACHTQPAAIRRLALEPDAELQRAFDIRWSDGQLRGRSRPCSRRHAAPGGGPRGLTRPRGLGAGAMTPRRTRGTGPTHAGWLG